MRLKKEKYDKRRLKLSVWDKTKNSVNIYLTWMNLDHPTGHPEKYNSQREMGVLLEIVCIYLYLYEVYWMHTHCQSYLALDVSW